MKLKNARFGAAAIALLAIVVVGLSISGCGGSSSSSSSTSPSISVSGPDLAGYITVNGTAGMVSGAGVIEAVDTSVSSPAACNTISEMSKQNGSFSLAVCASTGDTVTVSFTNSNGKTKQLGSFVVPSALSLAGTGASANPCGADQRQLKVTNSSSQNIWVSGGGSALRAVCVVNSTTSCLPIKSSISGSSCECGTSTGTLVCPTGTSQPTSDGLNCACTKNSQCGSSAGCNTNTHLCYDALPKPTDSVGFGFGTPPWNWELPAGGKSVNFCLDASSVSYNGAKIPSAVWWGGGVFARTGCKPDGTSCTTADCNTLTYKGKANPNSDCLAGVGGDNPYSIAEFTLQRTATDFYDITLINGANIAAQMAPIGNSTAPLPSGDSAAYWCEVPGSACSFDFGTYTKAVPLGSPVDYSPLLMHTSERCTVDSGNPPVGCPAGYSCSGKRGATNGVCYKTCSTDSDCPSGLHCLAAGNGQKYCQCETQSDCGTGQFCGTTYVPGIGGASPQLYIQQCGSFAGWWTADDFCGNANDVVDMGGSPVLNCGASITDGDGGATNIASLFGCNAASSTSQKGNPANQKSCYNNSNPSPTNACCGCATSSANPLFTDWPSNATSSCYNNNTTWASDVQPWLVNLKKACPTAYSYPYDDPTSTFQCQGTGSTNMLGYQITFKDLPRPSSE